MKKIQIEQFEKDFETEIKAFKSINFSSQESKPFFFPSYNFFSSKIVSLVFAIPAAVALFAIFFFPSSQSSVGGDLAMLEASNDRIMQEISSLDEYEN